MRCIVCFSDHDDHLVRFAKAIPGPVRGALGRQTHGTTQMAIHKHHTAIHR